MKRAITVLGIKQDGYWRNRAFMNTLKNNNQECE